MIQALFQLAQVAAAASLLAPGVLESPVGPVADRYRGTFAEIEIATPAVESANIDIDGRIDDAAGAQAALLDGFTQVKPIAGTPASQRPEVVVLGAADAVSVAGRG